MKPECSSIWSSVMPMASKSFRTFCTAGSFKSMVEVALGRVGTAELMVTSRGGIMDCAGGCCGAEEWRCPGSRLPIPKR